MNEYHEYHEWCKLTSDAEILEMITGARITFTGHCPIQHQSPPNTLPRSEEANINAAIQKLIGKHIVIPCSPEPVEFVSPIFTTPKKDGSIRLILNLKKLNVCRKLPF